MTHIGIPIDPNEHNQYKNNGRNCRQLHQQTHLFLFVGCVELLPNVKKEKEKG